LPKSSLFGRTQFGSYLLKYSRERSQEVFLKLAEFGDELRGVAGRFSKDFGFVSWYKIKFELF